MEYNLYPVLAADTGSCDALTAGLAVVLGVVSALTACGGFICVVLARLEVEKMLQRKSVSENFWLYLALAALGGIWAGLSISKGYALGLQYQGLSDFTEPASIGTVAWLGAIVLFHLSLRWGSKRGAGVRYGGFVFGAVALCCSGVAIEKMVPFGWITERVALVTEIACFVVALGLVILGWTLDRHYLLGLDPQEREKVLRWRAFKWSYMQAGVADSARRMGHDADKSSGERSMPTEPRRDQWPYG